MPLIDLNGLGHFKDKENAMIANDYSASSTYAGGDYVFYNGTLYKCKTAITTAEAWTSGHWEAAVLTDAVSELNTKINLNYAYIEDIATITKTYTEYTKDSAGVTVEVGKTITNGVVSDNSKFSYIAYTVQQDGFFYCTASPTESRAYLYSGSPIGAETYIMGILKANFPTANNPLRVLAGQVVAVCAKTTAATQVIYLSDNGTASLPEDVEIDKLAKGYYPISNVASFVIGRWGADGSHTSTNIARNTAPLVFDHDVVAICDLGYIFYNWLKYENDSWTVVKEDSCVALFESGVQYRINICEINESALTSVDDVIDHVKLVDVITSDYNKYKETFFGFDMYNKVAFCGDSYTMKRSTYDNCWGQIIGQRLGITVSLFGHSGYTTSSFRDGTESGASLTSLLSAQAHDLYWFGFGINDGAKYKTDQTYLGSLSDLSGSYSDYPHTFYGNYGCIIESVMATFPNAKIVLCNVMYHDARTAQIGSSTTNIPEINTALAEIAAHYGIPLIDLLSDVFYRSPEYQNNMQASAYTHPDPILFPGMASANMRLFSKCVAENTSYFKTQA